ncbi:MAG: CotH kinase family protein, partial [Lachnospiraceae bacterium]|nr:CotH kinase family protein [Lachnospiraceae bacterium]
DLDIKNLQKDNAPFYNPGRCYEDNEIKGYYYDQNPADISGGYLLSIDPNSDRAKAGFYLDKNIFFRIKSPRNASKEEVEYIRDFMLKVGQEIDGGDNDEDSDIAYIDPKSFAKRYLIEETFANHDAQIGSYYFYKKNFDDRLYAGPCWDYDLLYLQHFDPAFINSGSVLDNEEAEIDWDKNLLNKAEYISIVKKEMNMYARVWDRLIKRGLDDYYWKIQYSLLMDNARWNNKDGTECLSNGHYESVDNNIRFLKYALSERLNFLADKWNIEYDFLTPEKGNGMLHRVTFVTDEGNLIVKSIADGECIGEDLVPECSQGRHWVNEKAYDEYLWTDLPVYEDVTYVLVDEAADS